MNRFSDDQRITVQKGPLEGREGVVVRLRMADNGAWVNILGSPLPEGLRAFGKDDKHGRGNYALLYPENCEAHIPASSAPVAETAFACRVCGPRVAVDEDGCCVTCGRDTTEEEIPQTPALDRIRNLRHGGPA
jgi:hypothetical protein